MNLLIAKVLSGFLEITISLLMLLWVFSGFGIVFISAAFEDGDNAFAIGLIIFDLIVLIIAIIGGIYKMINGKETD